MITIQHKLTPNQLWTLKRLRRILHFDGSLGGRERVDWAFCKRLMRELVPEFTWNPEEDPKSRQERVSTELELRALCLFEEETASKQILGMLT
jgi:hypothetical protein